MERMESRAMRAHQRTRGYENDNTPTYIEQLKTSLAANPDVAWEDYQFHLVGGADPIRFPIWIAMNEKV